MNIFSNRLIEGIDNEVLLFLLGSTLAAVFVVRSTRKAIRRNDQEAVQRQEEEEKKRARNPMINANQLECSVCLEPFLCPVQTNCGHYYCAKCFLQMFNYSPGVLPAPVRCPLCRRAVDVAHISFSEEERAAEENKELITRIKDYNSRFSNEPRTVMQMIRDAPTLLRRLWRDCTTGGILMLLRHLRLVLLFVFLIFYLLSPFDFIPESAYGVLGLLDDLIIVSFLLLQVANLYRASQIARN